MKKMFWASALTLTFVAGLTACGDSSSSGPDQTQTSGLPATCEAGEQAFAEGVAYTCVDGGWAPAPADNPGENTQVASSSSTTPASTNSNTAKSSSSRANSVNSGTASSSSVAVTAKCGDETYEVGAAICDKRDNTVYRVTTIATKLFGSLTWMAQNLNYQAGGDFCYHHPDFNDEDNCKHLGRLYTWAEARGKTEEECGLGTRCSNGGKSVQGICPDGFHLPDHFEWSDLVAATGGESQAATELSDPGWDTFLFDEQLGPSTREDKYHFDALPSGFYSARNDKFYQDGFHMWLDSDNTEDKAWTAYVSGSTQTLEMEGYKTDGYSIRCVQDRTN